MIKSQFKLPLVLTLTLAVFSCQLDKSFEDTKEQGYKTLPKRKDTWFTNPQDKFDPYGDLSREDYQGLTNARSDGPNSLVKPKLKVPGLASLVEDPEEQEIVNDKLVSISVNETVPLKEVIVELARRAEVDVEVDKDIDGGIIFIAKDKPFSEVIKRICKMANLKYSFSDGILKIEKDNPVLKNYKFNILDIARSSESSINTSFSVGGGSEGGGSTTTGGTSGSSTSSSLSGGSNSSMTSKSGDGDVWKNIEAGINQLLSKYTDRSSASGGAANAATQTGESGVISINKNAGIISVLATEKQHKAIKEFLDKTHIELTSQVLIEARVVEVTLSDDFNSGIQWGLISGKFASTGGLGSAAGFDDDSASADFGKVFRPTATSGFNVMALPQELFGNDNSTIDATVNLLQTFGTTRSLSNPRITALNNQNAVLNFSKNEVYFEVEQNSTTTTGTSSTTQDSVSTTIKTVPIGIVLNLQPSIDLNRDEILLMLRPTLTRITSRVDDPGAQIIAKDAGLDLDSFESKIPVVDTRELDTMLRIKNGEIMVIGGLLEERSDNTDTGIPGISKVPYIGNAFKSVSKSTSNVETVIFIKATIIPGRGVTLEDEDFYKKFTTSRTKFFQE